MQIHAEEEHKRNFAKALQVERNQLAKYMVTVSGYTANPAEERSHYEMQTSFFMNTQI